MQSQATDADQQPQKLLFRVDEACVALGIGRTSFYQEERAGRLRTIRAAGRKLVYWRDLESYCEDRRAEAERLRERLH